MFHVKHKNKIWNNVPRETLYISINILYLYKIVIINCFLLKICYYIYGAININGTRSGSEDSSLNVLYLCAPFFIGDNMNDIYYMKIALKEAEKAYKHGEVPIGAVIVKNNKIIGKGYNLKEKKYNAMAHAEILAITKASKKIKNWRLNGCTIYVTMIPCPMCASAINQSRISKVIYGTVPNTVDKEIIYKILNGNEYGVPVEIVENVLNDECSSIIRKFFKKKR